MNVDVREGQRAGAEDVALEEAFGEVKLADLSPHYDFLSLRAGIQPFVSDFRGFIFSDSEPRARASSATPRTTAGSTTRPTSTCSRRTPTASSTPSRSASRRSSIANVFRQDFSGPGYTLSAQLPLQPATTPTLHYDANGFLVRPAADRQRAQPHEVRVALRRAWPATATRPDQPVARVLLGVRHDERQPDRGPDGGRQRADWRRLELSYGQGLGSRSRSRGFFASGDDDPRDGKAARLRRDLDNPNFAGGPFSFWSRSGIAAHPDRRAAEGARQPAAQPAHQQVRGPGELREPGPAAAAAPARPRADAEAASAS